MDFFKRQAAGPEVVADALFASLGRIVIVDQGWYPIMLRGVLKVLDLPLLTEVITRIAHFLPDYQVRRFRLKMSRIVAPSGHFWSNH